MLTLYNLVVTLRAVLALAYRSSEDNLKNTHRNTSPSRPIRILTNKKINLRLSHTQSAALPTRHPTCACTDHCTPVQRTEQITQLRMESSFKIVKMRSNQAIICRPHIKPNSVISLTTLRHNNTHPHNRTLPQSVPAATGHTQQHPALQGILRRHVWATTAPKCQVPTSCTAASGSNTQVQHCLASKAFIIVSRNLLPPCLCNCYENTKCCDNLLTALQCRTSRGNNICKRFK